MAQSHIFTSPIADGTNTQLVRPSNWNSGHNEFLTLSGNTAGASTLSGTNIVYQGGNNVTLSGNGQTLIFSAPDVSQYLTTAAMSNHAHSDYLTTAMASNRGSDFVQATAAFAGTNASGTIGSAGISIAVGNYITTGAMSDHSHGNPTLALTNLTGTTASASNGLTISLSAAAPAAGVGIAAGTRTATTAGNLLFDTGNGITFGLNAVGGSVMTASHNGLTTAMASNYGSNFMGTNSAITQNGVSMTANSSGLSLNFPAFLTTAQPPGAYLTTARASNDAIGLNSALTANGVSMTANSSGLSLNFPAFLTTAAQSGHSHGNPTLALTNLNGTTASASNGLTISLSVAAGGGDGYNIVRAGSVGTTGTVWSALSGTINFNGSNGIIVSQNNSNDLVLDGSNFATAMHFEGNTVGASSAPFNGQAMHLVGGNNITLSGNGSSVTIVGPTPGAGGAISQRWMAGMDFPPVLVVQTNITGISLQELLYPFHIDGTLTASELMWQMSRSTSGSNLFSVHVGIYSFVNSTQISLIGSNSHSFSNTATASISGIRQFEVSCGTNFSTLAPGDYVLGLMFSAAATASMNYSLMGNSVANPAVGVIIPGADQYSTATSHQYIPFWGRHATNSAALRNSIGASQVIGGFAGASLPLPTWFNLGY